MSVVKNITAPFVTPRTITEIDACILTFSQGGSFSKNMSPAAWKAASFAEKYAAATSSGTRVIGAALYKSIAYDVDVNYQVNISSARDSAYIKASSPDIAAALAHYCAGHTLLLTLREAVCLKTYAAEAGSLALPTMAPVNGIRLSRSVTPPELLKYFNWNPSGNPNELKTGTFVPNPPSPSFERHVAPDYIAALDAPRERIVLPRKTSLRTCNVCDVQYASDSDHFCRSNYTPEKLPPFERAQLPFARPTTLPLPAHVEAHLHTVGDDATPRAYASPVFASMPTTIACPICSEPYVLSGKGVHDCVYGTTARFLGHNSVLIAAVRHILGTSPRGFVFTQLHAAALANAHPDWYASFVRQQMSSRVTRWYHLLDRGDCLTTKQSRAFSSEELVLLNRIHPDTDNIPVAVRQLSALYSASPPPEELVAQMQSVRDLQNATASFNRVSEKIESVISGVPAGSVGKLVERMDTTITGIDSLTAALTTAVTKTTSFCSNALDITGERSGTASRIMLTFGSFIMDILAGAYTASDRTFTSFVACVGRVLVRIFSITNFTASLEIAKRLSQMFFSGIKSLYFYFSSETPLESIDTFFDAVEEPEVLDVQLGPTVPSFLALISATLGTIFMGTIPSTQTLKNVNECMRTFTLAVPVAGNLQSLAGYISAYLPECVTSWFSVICPSDALYKKLVIGGDFAAWMAEVDVLSDPAQSQRLITDYLFQERVIACHSAGTKLMLTMAVDLNANVGSRMFQIVSATTAKIEKLHIAVQGARDALGTRDTPLCIYLTGLPGVGKSTFMALLAQLLRPAGLSPDDPNLTYVRNAASDHWDGYRSQPIVIIDDFAQNVEGNDLNELILSISNATFVLPMASLNDTAIGKKGTTFSSKVVICSSNTPYPADTTKVRCSEAIYRRRHLLIRMHPTGKPADAHWSHVDFALLNPVDPKARPSPMPFMELLRHILEVQKKHVGNQDLVNVNLAAGRTCVEELRSFAGIPKEILVAQMVKRQRPFDLADADTFIETGNHLRMHPDGSYETYQGEYNAILGCCTETCCASMKNIPITQILRRLESPRVMAAATVTEFAIALEDLEKTTKTWKDEHPAFVSIMSMIGVASATGIAAYLLYKIFTKFRPKNKVTTHCDYVAAQKALPKCANPACIAVATEVNAGKKFAPLPPLHPEDMDLYWKDGTPDDHTMCMTVHPATIAKPPGYVPQSFDEKIKARRNVAYRRKFIAQKRRDIRKAVDRLATVMPSYDTAELKKAADKVAAELDIYDAAYSTGTEPTEEWTRRLSEGVEEFFQVFESTFPQFPISNILHKAVDNLASQDPQLIKQSLIDVSARNLADTTFMPALVKVSVGDNSLAGVMVKGTTILLPRHIFSNGLTNGRRSLCPTGTTITLTHSTGISVTNLFDPKRYCALSAEDGTLKDLCLYTMDAKLRAFSDITGHFAQERDLRKYALSAGMLLLYPGMSAYPVMHHLSSIRSFNTHKIYNIGPEESPETVDIMQGWEYTSNTIAGDCGGMVCASNTAFTRKIIGIHVAGSRKTERGNAEYVTIEMLNRGFALLKQPLSVTGCPTIASEKTGSLETAKCIPAGNFTVCEYVLPQYCVRSPIKTRLAPSALFEKIVANTKQPAVLTPRDERPDPSGKYKCPNLIVRGVEKFGRTTTPLNPVHLQKSIDYVSALINAVMHDDPRFVATEEEAINGIPHIANCDPLDLSTSPGYPYCLSKEPGVVGKRGVIDGPDGERRVIDPELRKALDERHADFKKCKRVPSVWVACLKDELKDTEKIWKTRTFIYGPTDMTILTRMYCLAFSSAFFRHNCEFFNAAGLDPNSDDWTTIANTLNNHSELGFAGDYGNYDGTLMPELIDSVCTIINAWYKDSEENQNVRRTLFHEFIHTLILCGDTLLYKHTGNPSGNPLTTVINGCANELLFATAWQDLAPPEYRDLAWFHKLVRLFVLGDDNTVSVKKEAFAWFNMRTISEWMAAHGLEYTSPDKKSAISDGETFVLDFSFLKGNFRRVGKRFMYALDTNSIAALLNWVKTRKDNDIWGCTEEAITEALRLSFAHGEEYYTSLRTKCIEACAEIGKFIYPPAYQFFEEQYAKKNFLPNLAYNEEEGMFMTHDFNSARIRGVPAPEELEAQSDQLVRTTDEMTTQSELGITVIQQAVPEIGERTQVAPAASAAHVALQDMNWTVKNQVAKEILVETLTWSNSNAVGSFLRQYTIPGETILAASPSHEAFLQYAYFRGAVKLRIQVTGSRMAHSGALLCYFVPLTTKNIITRWHGNNTSAATSVPHVVLDPATCNVGEIDCDFVNPKGFLDLRNLNEVGLDFLGTLNIQVLNYLRVGAGAPTSLAVSISVSYVDGEFRILLPRSLTLLTKHGQDDELAVLLARTKAYLEAKKEDNDPEKDHSSELVRAMAKAIGVQVEEEEEQAVVLPVPPFPRIAPMWTQRRAPEKLSPQGQYISKNYNVEHSTIGTIGGDSPTNEVAHGASASVPMPLDKPTIGTNPPPVQLSLGYFSNSTNLEFAEVMTLVPNGALSDEAKIAHFQSKTDEMSLSYLLQKWNLSHTVNINTASTGMLAYGSISPMSPLITGQPVSQKPNLTNPFNMTTLDFFSCKHSYWRGSIKIRLEFIASPFNTARFFLGFQYATEIPPTSMTLETVTNMYGAYIDLNAEQHTFEFVMDYQAPTEVLAVAASWGYEQHLERSCGFWSLWVINPLVAPQGVPTDIDVNVWFAGGEDYALFTPSDNNASIYSPFVTTTGRIEELDAQAGPIHVLPNIAPVNSMPFGPPTDSIASILKRNAAPRFLRFGAASFDSYILDVGALVFGNDAIISSFPATYTPQGMFTFYGSAFRGCRGTIRMKIRLEPDSATSTDTPMTQPIGFTVAYSPDPYPSNVVTAGSSPQTYLSIALFGKQYQSLPSPYPTLGQSAIAFTASDASANHVTIEIPYEHIYKFAMIYHGNTEPRYDRTSFSSLGKVMVITPNIGSLIGRSAEMTFWISAGDDFRLGLYQGPPLTSSNTTNVGNDLYQIT